MRTPELRFDFSGRRARVPVPGVALLVAGIAALTVAAAALGQIVARDRAALQELERRQVRATPSPPKAVKDPRDAVRLKASLQLAKSLDSPWAELLSAIESTRPDRVALLSVEPSATKHTLLITAEARDSATMLEHLRALENESGLRTVTLLQHERALQVPGTPTRYRLQGEW